MWRKTWKQILKYAEFFCQNFFGRFSRAEMEAENNSNEDEELIDPITITVNVGASLKWTASLEE